MKKALYLLSLALMIMGCKKALETKVTESLNSSSFFKTQNDAFAAVTAMYQGLLGGAGNYYAGMNAAIMSWRAQDSQTTDELVCNWDDGGSWKRLNTLNFTPDVPQVTSHYNNLQPYISNITICISKIQSITMDASVRSTLIAELKGLRGFYEQKLFNYYGPVPLRLDPQSAADPDAAPIPRLSNDEMVAQIEKDYKEAAAVLPDKRTGSDYGRFSKAACLTGLMKLYMHEKKWQEAIVVGTQIRQMGFKLVDNYSDNFSYNNKGGNSEIIFAIPCSPTATLNNNAWLPHVLPSDFVDPSGLTITAWGGYRMPWKTFFKFAPQDKRTARLYRIYPTWEGKTRDAYTGGDIGAVPMKFSPDPTGTNSEKSGVDLPIFRYADVELLLAEALNEANGGPTSEAYDMTDDIRRRAGLDPYSRSLNQTQFRAKLQDERLFELWCEAVRREDLIRWELYIQRAIDDGSTTATTNNILYPLPRTAIQLSKGLVKQNPGYN